MWFISRRKKRRRWHDYWESDEGEGEGEREVLTLSKLANRSASRMLWRGGEEGAKGSAKGSLAGREEEGKSPECGGTKCPRRWKESEDSVLEMDALLPEEKKGTAKIQVSMKINRINKLNCEKTDQALARILKHILLTHSEISDKSTTIWQKTDQRMWVLTWRWRRWSRRCTSFWGQCWGHIRAGRLGVFLEQVLIVDAKLIRAIWLKHKVHTKPNTSNKYSI